MGYVEKVETRYLLSYGVNWFNARKNGPWLIVTVHIAVFSPQPLSGFQKLVSKEAKLLWGYINIFQRLYQTKCYQNEFCCQT